MRHKPTELQVQKKVCDAVVANGGVAFKMSHKFLAGVPDLFIKPHYLEPSIWEVKICTEFILRKSFVLPLTKLQDKWLREYEKAGGFCGVISFVRGKANFSMTAFAYHALDYSDSDVKRMQVSFAAHQEVERGNQLGSIYNILMRSYDARIRARAESWVGDRS